jgi:hypothetical protein
VLQDPLRSADDTIPVNQPLATLRIDRRFRGPPRSGNGGYVCGRLAEFIEGDCRVRLLRPPPLERELSVVADADGLSLLDGDRPVAQARPQLLELTLPARVGLEEARARSHHFRGFESHAFDSCFVCGPQREPGDGLRIFPGAGKDDSLVASPWRPDASLGGADGRVRRCYLWAALDCPSGWAYLHPGGRVAVLGELAVHVAEPVPVAEELVVIGWPIIDPAEDPTAGPTAGPGRKHRCGSALFSADGRPLAWAAATWFDIDPKNFNT